MSDTQAATPAQDVLDKAVAEGGAYEVLHKRLLEQGQRLRQTAERLNASRLEEFGDSQMDVIGRVRIRTENNCIARDIVQVGDCLLFGYNVFIGLRKETGVADVFSLYRLVEGSEGYEAEPVPLGDSFLAAPGFVNDFNELYTYYNNTRLLQLAIRDGKLLASFQIGERITDIRVFRWSISSDGSEVRYIDNRGERDIALPAPFDFEWQRATREMVVEGRFPHLNILDTLFVETIGGDLTIKVENNTEVGLGIYREEVMDKTQSLDDAQVEFARLGSLLLLKVLPYREEQWRYLVFNSLTGKVERIDAIGLACIQLPEDHGIIFPGGYYLQNGEYRTFEQSMEGMRFKRSVRSPNGEDVQYVFYHPEQGRNVLLTYNLINRQLQNPLFGHGYARLEDGRMVIFAAEGEEPTRIPGPSEKDGIKIAIIGRPNVGKSTLVNRMLGEERVIVYDQAGTTRDSIYIPFERNEEKYTLIDTAGVRRRGKIFEAVEKFSVVKTLQAIQDANVVIFVMDAREGVVEHDLKLLGFVLETGRALVIALNKWDGMEAAERDYVKTELERRLLFVDFADIHFISALHGTGVGHLYKSVQESFRSAVTRWPTSRLTSILEDAVQVHQPPMVNGRRIKLRYAHLGGANPPLIVIHGNQVDAVPKAYTRYLEKTYRRVLKLVGTPIRIEYKGGENPYEGKKNSLTARQVNKKRRLMSHHKKAEKKKKDKRR